MPTFVKCPKCSHVFDSDETFYWGCDWNGDPTIEQISCPKCKASTKPRDGRRKVWDYDDFTVVLTK